MTKMEKINMSETKQAWLLLQDGTLLSGESFGAEGRAVGEVVFSTAMTGYQEALTDPNYAGQILIQTFPMMGNYGVNSEDFTSGRCWLKGCIVREWCEAPSNFRCTGRIDQFLKEQGVIALCGIDTRQLTALLRDKGTMAGMITTEPIEDKEAALRQIGACSPAVPADLSADRPADIDGSGRRIAVVDLGSPFSAAEELAARGCAVHFAKASDSADELAAFDGVVLSEGPGDPAACTEAKALAAALAEKKVPLLGIGLGHQVLALSQGAKTEKLPYGHRGASQPVIDLRTGKTYPTAQNHGYVVTDLPASAGEISHQNVNDHSCEGIRYTSIPAISVQFRPVGPGESQDTGYIFDKFLAGCTGCAG